MNLYEYSQNNSGGRFIAPAIYVYVEADSKAEADEIVQKHGVYFDGCETGEDCDCCGGRWSRAWREPVAEPDPMAKGFEGLYEDWARGAKIPLIMVVRADGKVEWTFPPEKGSR